MVTSKWISNELPSILQNRDGIKIGPFGSQLKKEFLSEHGQYKVYGQENVYADDFSLGSRHISSSKFADLMSCELVGGDVVISTMGTIGQCSIVPDNIQPGIMDSHLIRLRLNTKLLDRLYLKYFIQSEQVQRQIKELSVGGIMDGLSTTIVKKIIIDYPSVPEQRRIAAVLSDADGYIAALEKLIAKKRLIKQGAMQKLLTGKRRLPGFEGEWMDESLEQIAIFYDNLRMPIAESKREVGQTPYYGANGIQGYIKGFTHKGEFVLIAEDGANDLSNYPVRFVTGEVWVNNHAHVIQGKPEKADTLFLSYRLAMMDYQAILVGGTRAKLNGKVLKNIEVTIPPTPDEQTAIAEILSDMDAEIAALEKKLNKARLIKQGMMQELLTGRIRLTEQETESTPGTAAAPKIVELPKREPKTVAAQTGGHNQQFDDAVMIAGIVNVLYSDKFPLGRKKVQKCLYLLRRHQDESTAAFKKKAAGPYADEVRYRGGEPIAQSAKYIKTTTSKGKGTTFARGDSMDKALGYIRNWGRQSDIQWVADNLRFKKVDDLELLATVDKAICDLTEAGTPISVASIKHLIATNEEWKAKLKKQTFSDANIARAIKELQTLLQGGN